jgi:lipid-binding SYLF domain-containing protein
MKAMLGNLILIGALGISVGTAHASRETDATGLFNSAGESASYFNRSYAYAIFPTIGKGGLGVGAAHGTGHVYRQGRLLGRVTMNQLSVGWQAGGEAYSEIIFFQDKSALDNFTSGNFEFSGDVGATVITASASASAGSTGENSGASADQHQAATQGEYHHGMAVFEIAKGGLMFNATVEGQKFSYRPRAGEKVAARS